MAGNLNSDSVIWVVGDTTGRDVAGASAVIPTSNEVETDATQTELDALEARLVASGVLPNTNF